jgi:bacteriocin biosynthesis cyclodehydratase domain-containing protein
VIDENTTTMSSNIIQRLQEEVQKPAFNPTVVPVQVDENTLHIRGGTWSSPILTLSSPDDQGVISELVERIDGETAVDTILKQYGEDDQAEIAKVLYRLHEIDAIYDRETLDRQPLYNHHAIKTTFQQPERDHLGATTVLIVNAGRIGPYVADHLLEMGVGEIQFRELDDVSTADLAGFATCDRVSRAEEDDLDTVVKRSDFVVYTVDRPYPEVEREVNRTTHRHETPWVIGQIEGYDGHIGPAIFPGETACLECFRTRVAANATNPEGLRAYRNANHATNDTGAWVSLPPFAHAVASLLSMDLVHLLLYGTGYTSGRAIWMNSIDFSFDADRVLKLPRCQVCGADPVSAETPFISMEEVPEITDLDISE